MSEAKHACVTDWGKRTIVLVDEGGCAYFCTLRAGHQGPHRWEPEIAPKRWRDLVNAEGEAK